MIASNTLHIERTFHAPAEAVFDAWTSAEVIRRWWQAEHGWETSEAEVDLRVGGVVRVVMRDPANDVEYGGGGTYTEIEPPTRLAFTWIWDGDTTRTLIESTSRRPTTSRPSGSPTVACGTRRPCAPTRAGGAGSSTTSSAPCRRLAPTDSRAERAPASRGPLRVPSSHAEGWAVRGLTLLDPRPDQAARGADAVPQRGDGCLPQLESRA